MAAFATIDDQTRTWFLSELLGLLGPGYSVVDCRTDPEGAHTSVTLGRWPLVLPPLELWRTDIDSAVRGSEGTARVVWLQLAGHLAEQMLASRLCGRPLGVRTDARTLLEEEQRERR